MADEIDVLIEDEPPVVDPPEIGDPVEPRVEPKTKAAAPVTDPNEGVDILKKQLEQSQADAAAHAKRAAAAEQTVVAAQTEVHQTNIQMVENAIAATKASLDNGEVAYAEALAAGDFAAAAKIQRQMSVDAANQLTLEAGLEGLKAAPKPVAPAPPVVDPVEQMASQLTPKSGAWVRAHPDYARVPRLQQQLLAAHNLVVTRENAPELDSPEYFAAIERTLEIAPARTQAADDTTEVALSDGARQAGGRGTETSPPAAPARNGGGGAPRTVRLTAAEVEAAEMSGMTPAEYAREKEKIAKANRLN